MDTPERKKGLEWKEAQRQGDFTNNFNIYTYTSQNIYTGCVSVCDKFLHWPPVSVRKNIYTLQQDKCKCKKLGHVSVNDLHLRWIYTPYIRLWTLRSTTLVSTLKGTVLGIWVMWLAPASHWAFLPRMAHSQSFPAFWQFFHSIKNLQFQF
jgi:hypothetical protein